MKFTDFQLKQRDPSRPLEADFATPEGWIVARAPGSVYEALQAAGLIPDPFYDRNELQVQWVGEADWLYRAEFEAEVSEPFADLVFDGLDTVARVWLNGELVLESDNMFVPRRLDVRNKLRQGANQLWILFASALKHGKALEAAHGGPRPLWNGDSSRLFVRKAQYHYGWDWGPTLLTAGVWREARLETYAARIAELYCPVNLEDDLLTAEFPVRVSLEGQLEGATVKLELYGPGGEALGMISRPASADLEHVFVVGAPQLWWPNTYGEQPLYHLVSRLERDGIELDAHSQKLGVRRLRLIQEPQAGGVTSFYFEVNHTPIFAGGANWIPEGIPTTRVSPADYRQRILQAKAANMTMLRVWGGGIYEDEEFYDLCDAHGLLVWQDFMFACGIYPAHAGFVESVRLEAATQIKRLRQHPCLALWCANNEDYQLAYGQRLYKGHLPPEQNPEFPARVIYERLLPQLCAELDPATPYRPGSPYGGSAESGYDPDDQTQGDRHTWEIWHRETYPYQDYPKKGGTFVSEFGMQGAASLGTLKAALPPEELHPFSRGFEHHNKASDGYRRIVVYLTDNLALPSDLEGYIYATQLVQSEALSSAYRGWRRRFAGPGHIGCGGALVWQLNDCWPVQSWAIVDSSGVPKPAYYSVRRALAPVVVGLWSTASGAGVWAVNSRLSALEATLELRVLSLDGQELSHSSRAVRLPANQAFELGELEAPENTVIAARLLEGEEVLSRFTLWPEPYKYLTLPSPNLRAVRLGQDRLVLRTDRPVKGVWLEAKPAPAAEAPGVEWSDNLIDLNPGDERVIEAKGLGLLPVRLRYMGSRGAMVAADLLEAAPVVGD